MQIDEATMAMQIDDAGAATHARVDVAARSGVAGSDSVRDGVGDGSTDGGGGPVRRPRNRTRARRASGGARRDEAARTAWAREDNGGR